MNKLPTPLSDMSLRLPEAGRIRLGEKGTNRPRAIPNFRFTSRDETALQQVAARYGGTVMPWRDRSVAAGQYELRTSAAEIEVALPPDPISVNYELWSQGGNQRRCDGETCALVSAGPEGPEIHDVPCVCYGAQEMTCKLKVRLSVLLPDIRFTGTWRLETGSNNAAHELPGMVEIIQKMAPGLQRAILRIEQRKEVRFGKTKNFQVPVLGLDHTPTELAQGAARVGALPEAPTPLALVPGAESDGLGDEDIAEGEIVDEHISFDEATGPHPISTELCDKWRDELTVHQRNRVLIRARDVALDMGEPVPGSVETITYPVIDALIAEGA